MDHFGPRLIVIFRERNRYFDMAFKQERSDKLNKLVFSQETSLDCFRQVFILKGTQRNKSLETEKNI